MGCATKLVAEAPSSGGAIFCCMDSYGGRLHRGPAPAFAIALYRRCLLLGDGSTRVAPTAKEKPHEISDIRSSRERSPATGACR